MRIFCLLLLAGVAVASEPVITFDYVDGYTPPRVHKEPYLTIYSDGKVRAVDPFSKAKPVFGKMPVEQVKALVKELEPKLGPLDLPDIGVLVEDAATTVVTAGKKTGRLNALDLWARRCPKHKGIQDLYAAARQLDLIWNVTLVGGEVQAKKLLAQANGELKKAWPKAKPFELADMRASATRVAFFRREKKRWISIVIVGRKVEVRSGS